MIEQIAPMPTEFFFFDNATNEIIQSDMFRILTGVTPPPEVLRSSVNPTINKKH